jgi:hypothetical protein
VISAQTGSGEPDAFDRWRNALAEVLHGPADVTAWQDRRYSFAHKVGQFLTSPSPGGLAVTDHVVYGVYVAGGGLLYVGQTADAKRRLRDLPVGESHHLATTVPPEVWERVIVIQWPSLLSRLSDRERRVVEQLQLLTCGLALEHLLQVSYCPVMSTRRRNTKGGWSERNTRSSRSRGAVASAGIPELFSHVQENWDELAKITQKQPSEPVTYSAAGRAVFPGGLLLPVCLVVTNIVTRPID